MPKGIFSEHIRASRKEGIKESDVCKICGEPATKRCRHICSGYSLGISTEVECTTLLCGRAICEEKHNRTSVLHIL